VLGPQCPQCGGLVKKNEWRVVPDPVPIVYELTHNDYHLLLKRFSIAKD
jgi:hypothetical protein